MSSFLSSSVPPINDETRQKIFEYTVEKIGRGSRNEHWEHFIAQMLQSHNQRRTVRELYEDACKSMRTAQSAQALDEFRDGYESILRKFSL